MVVLMIARLSGFGVMSDQSSRSLFDQVGRLGAAASTDELVEKRLLDARGQTWTGIATGEPAHWQKADAAFRSADHEIADLRGQTVDPQRIAMVDHLQFVIGVFRAKRPN